MDHQVTMAFVRSLRHAFGTLFPMEVMTADPVVPDAPARSALLVARVRVSGEFEGHMELRAPAETARRLTTLMLGTEVDAKDDLVPDAIGEIAGMIAGGGAARLGATDTALSCPEVTFGGGVAGFVGQTEVSVPCGCDCGEFSIVLCVRRNAGRVGRAAA